MDKLCVECGAVTEVTRHEDVSLEVCREGCGMWLHERELLDAVRTQGDGRSIGNRYEEGRSLALAADHDVEQGDRVRDCPMCRTAMGSVRYGFDTDVVVDVCATHGVWLDDGELEALEAWAAERADPASAESRARDARLTDIASGDEEYVYLRPSFTDVVRGMLARRRG